MWGRDSSRGCCPHLNPEWRKVELVKAQVWGALSPLPMVWDVLYPS